MTNNEIINFRSPTPQDAKAIHKLVEDSKVLDVNSKYCYALIGLHFSQTSIVATCEDKIIAFVSAYLPNNSTDSLFIWQIAVSKEFQKQGLALKMLEYLNKQEKLQNIRFLQQTISPSNKASLKLFTSLAKKLNCKIDKQSLFSKEIFGQDHEEEDLYIIGPIK